MTDSIKPALTPEEWTQRTAALDSDAERVKFGAHGISVIGMCQSDGDGEEYMVIGDSDLTRSRERILRRCVKLPHISMAWYESQAPTRTRRINSRTGDDVYPRNPSEVVEALAAKLEALLPPE